MDYPRFIRINNKQAFLQKEWPDYHPQSLKYIEFWKEQKTRCIEGFWAQDTQDSEDEGSWRWMPPNLYFYVNLGTIRHRERKGEPFKFIRPYLRDVEWEFFYNWIECRGFSGFEGDDEYHCIRERMAVIPEQDGSYTPVWKSEEDFGKYWTSICKDQDGVINERMYYNYYKKDGTPKKFMKASEYLRKLHDKELGRALYNNDALHLFMLGSRGFGKSYMVGVGVVLHEWLFDGAKYYEPDPDKKWPGTVDVFVGAAIASKSSEILEKTLVAFQNLPGGWGKNENYKEPPFFKKTKGSLKPNNMKSPFRHEYEKKIGGDLHVEGSRSSIRHGVYTVENPEAAAGGRYTVMAIEEVGLMPNLLTVHGSNDAAQRIGSDMIGSSVYLGTGGNVEKIIESSIVFRDPEGFGFLPFENVYEPTDGGKIGWFVPAIYNMNSMKDENGNTDVEAAIEYYNSRREEKRNSKDKSALALEMMNYPLVPSEMFLNAGSNMFPVSELKAQYSHVVNNPSKWENLNQVGKMVMNPETKKPEFRHLSPTDIAEGRGEIKKFPLKDNKGLPGAVVIREHPKTDASGNIPYGRYLQGTDTYDDDESTTNSFGCTFIFDTFTNRIVAEYFGRVITSEFYETCRRLNIYYNTLHNYENNKPGLYGHYRNKNSTHLLADTPESLKSVENITIKRIGNVSKGTRASKEINKYARDLIVDWLLEDAAHSEEEAGLLNLHYVWGEGLLQELIYWTYEGNYDRVSALGMVMIMRADRQKQIEDSKLKGIEDAETIFEHSFWSRNYGRDSRSKYFNQQYKKLF